MSNTDSFIEEVNDEMRRDRLFGLLRRYGWIAALVLIAIIGGAGFVEYRKAQNVATAQSLGDAMLDALNADTAQARLDALEALDTPSVEGKAILAFMRANAEIETGNTELALLTLQSVENTPDLPLIYRQLAKFRILLLQSYSPDFEMRRAGLEELAVPGVPFRSLAEEQLALIDIDQGNTDSAIARYRALVDDAEASPRLQQRAIQAIVALGGSLEPDAAQPME